MSKKRHLAQLRRRHDITPSLPITRKKQYSQGKFSNEPTGGGALRDGVEKLERLVGKLTLKNELLERGLQHSLSQCWRKSTLSGHRYICVSRSN
ncbi:MAG: hypothetical protein ACUVTR_04020 [Dehalococcoidia bacterium]